MMRRNSLGWMVTAICLMFFLSGRVDAATRITLGGGAPGGTYYAVMVAMAKVLEDKARDIKPVVETTSGSAHAIRLVDSGELTISSGLLDTVDRGWKGEREFQKKKLTNLRTVMAFTDIGDAFVVRKNSPYRKVRDLKGKRIGVPSPAGQLALETVLKAHGIGPKDYTVRFLSYTAQSDALRDGTLDAAYMVVYQTNRTVMEFMTTVGGRILGFDSQKEAKAFEASQPVWRTVVLKAKTYAGQDGDVVAAGRHGLVVAHKDTPPDLIYKITKTLIENTADLVKIHPAAAAISLPQTKTYIDKKLIVVPFHPGAERYLKEAGALK